MFAKQTTTSASLGLALGGSFGLAISGHVTAALADPDPSTASPDGATGKLQLGVGYAADDKWFVTANVAQANLFGTGDSLSLFAGLSELHELFKLSFVQPHIADSNFTLSTQLYSDQRVMPGFMRHAVGGMLTASEQLSDHVHAYFGYRLEQVWAEPLSVVPAIPNAGAPPLGNDRISAVRAGIDYDSRDSHVLPSTGTDVGVSLEYADPLIGSQLQLATLNAWAGTNQRVGPAILHLDGTFTALASPSVIPLADRLFMMGSLDVRGFLPGAFGPIDADGDPIGGTMKLTGRASAEVPLSTSGLSLEGFLDYARIWDPAAPSAYVPRGVPTPLSGMAVGFGVIWHSPLGPVRVDLAFPLVRGGTPTLVFGMGQLF